MAEVMLDSDVVIWHLRGQKGVVDHVQRLAGECRLGISAITRTEVIAGLREREREVTLAFLDACEVLSVDRQVADLAGDSIRRQRRQGVTLHVPDALIGATAVHLGIPLHTCNASHYPENQDIVLVAATPDPS
ncbi:MAG: type II toxin-antitoxin system VapC family toxin [Bradymonadales bacterium]|nr:type II toxin-antitoxin system VapC family toxin [Bradymonadales bacterium]